MNMINARVGLQRIQKFMEADEMAANDPVSPKDAAPAHRATPNGTHQANGNAQHHQQQQQLMYGGRSNGSMNGGCCRSRPCLSIEWWCVC